MPPSPYHPPTVPPSTTTTATTMASPSPSRESTTMSDTITSADRRITLLKRLGEQLSQRLVDREREIQVLTLKLDETTNLQERLDMERAALTTVREENYVLLKRIEDMTATQSMSQDPYTDLTTELARLGSRLNEEQRNLIHLNEQCAVKDAEIEATRALCTEVERERDNMEAQCKQHMIELTQIREQALQQERDMTILSQTLAVALAEKEALESLAQTSQSEIENERFAEMEMNLENARQQIAVITAERDALAALVEMNANQVSSQDKVAQLTDELDRERQIVLALTTERDALVALSETHQAHSTPSSDDNSSTLQTLLLQEQQTNAGLVAERDALQAISQQHELHITSLQSELATVQVELDQERQTLSTLTAERDALVALSETHQDHSLKLDGKSTMLQEELEREKLANMTIVAERDTLQAISMQHETMSSSLEKELIQSRNDLNVAQQTITELQQHLEKEQQRVMALTAECAALAAISETYQDNAVELARERQAVAALSAERDTLLALSEIHANAGENQAFTAERDALQAMSDQHEARCMVLESDLVTARQIIDRHETNVATLSAERDALAAIVDSSSSKGVVGGGGELESLRKERDELANTNRLLTTRVEDFEDELKAASAPVKALSDEMVLLMAEITRLREELNVAKAASVQNNASSPQGPNKRRSSYFGFGAKSSSTSTPAVAMGDVVKPSPPSSPVLDAGATTSVQSQLTEMLQANKALETQLKALEKTHEIATMERETLVSDLAKLGSFFNEEQRQNAALIREYEVAKQERDGLVRDVAAATATSEKMVNQVISLSDQLAEEKQRYVVLEKAHEAFIKKAKDDDNRAKKEAEAETDALRSRLMDETARREDAEARLLVESSNV